MATNLSLSVVLNSLLGFLQQILSFFVPGEPRAQGPGLENWPPKHYNELRLKPWLL